MYWYLRAIYYHFDCCMRFDVVCSSGLGNARALVRGTDNKTIPRFFMCY